MFAWQHTIAFIACILLHNAVSAHNHGDTVSDVDSSHQHVRGLASEGKIQRCGTRSPTSAEMQEALKVVEKYMQKEGRQTSSVEIDMYFHVITDGTNGTLTDEQLQLQLQVINDSFSPYGFSFRLLGNTTTDNASWHYASWTSIAQLEMKQALRVGDASTLNVYFNSPSFENGDPLLGYATYPSSDLLDPDDDGVVVNYGSLPLGDITDFNLGFTLVHEVGHWLGLYHTFEGDSCSGQGSGQGDGVRDTPRQSSPTSGCPVGRNSCPLAPRKDPIENYMDYSDDACYTSFTRGQQNRMMAMWEEYRAN